MRKLISACLLITALFYSIVTAQDSGKSDDAWEYLIVSVSTFSNKENSNVSGKWLGRRQGNVGFYQEPQIQNEFDRLGKLGWQLVGVLPATTEINNNASIPQPKFIFKRKYNAERSEREAEERAKLENELKNRAAPAQPKNQGLIELDQFEFVAKEKEVRDRIKNKFEQSVKNTDIKMEIADFSYRPRLKDLSAKIVVDGNSFLLKDGNKYRSSEAVKYARQVAGELVDKIGLKPTAANEDLFSENISGRKGNVLIHLLITVGNGENLKTAAQGYISGNWVELE